MALKRLVDDVSALARRDSRNGLAGCDAPGTLFIPLCLSNRHPTSEECSNSTSSDKAAFDRPLRIRPAVEDASNGHKGAPLCA